MGKLINSKRQASRCQQAFSKPCMVNLISKEANLVFSIYNLQARLFTLQVGNYKVADQTEQMSPAIKIQVFSQ